MNVLIINPPYLKGYSRGSRSPAVTRSGTLYYPVFLSYLTGYLKKKKINIRLIDAIADNLNETQIKKIIEDFNPDFIICDAATPSGKSDATFLDELKKTFPATKCLLVGQYPSFFSEEIIADKHIFDAFITKEYDDAVYSFLINGINVKLENIYINKNGKFQQSGNIPAKTVNLDDLPFVSEIYKEHLNIKNYFYSAVKYPVITILSSRGCPYKCGFCSLPAGFYLNYRQRSVENLIKEFDYIKNELPFIKNIFIEDDSFNVQLDYVKEFCIQKIAVKNKIEWSINFSPSNFDEETIRLLKEANCVLTVIGYETANNELLKKIDKKNVSVSKYFELTDLLKKYGIRIHGCFMFGLPGETEHDALNTINTAIKLNPDTAQFFPLMLNPSTSLFYYYKYNNMLLNEQSDYNNESGAHYTNVSTQTLNAEKIMKLCALARKKFYLRFDYITNRIFKAVFSFDELKRLIRTFKNFKKIFF